VAKSIVIILNIEYVLYRHHLSGMTFRMIHLKTSTKDKIDGTRRNVNTKDDTKDESSDIHGMTDK
jgi:hypothetical protein